MAATGIDRWPRPPPGCRCRAAPPPRCWCWRARSTDRRCRIWRPAPAAPCCWPSEGEPVSQRGDEATLKRLAEAARAAAAQRICTWPRRRLGGRRRCPCPAASSCGPTPTASGAPAALTGSVRCDPDHRLGGGRAHRPAGAVVRAAAGSARCPRPRPPPAPPWAARPRPGIGGPCVEAGTPGPLSLEVQAYTSLVRRRHRAAEPPRPRVVAGGERRPAPAPELATAQTSMQDSAALSRPTRQQGRSFGRYMLVDRLGEGGMAQVYTAVMFGAEGFRRKFVVKRLRPELLDEPTVVAQFIDEANLASTLVHSNIVPVLDFGKVGDEYFLATEYILGRDLGRVTHAACEQRTGAGLPLAAVLYAAHEMLRGAGVRPQPSTGEGGPAAGHRPPRRLAQQRAGVGAGRGEAVRLRHRQGRGAGHPHPARRGQGQRQLHVARSRRAGMEVDARADLFSLGLVIYYCLTGEVLYQGDDQLRAAGEGGHRPRPGRDRAPARPARAGRGDLLARALAVDPGGALQPARPSSRRRWPRTSAGGGGPAGRADAHACSPRTSGRRRNASPAPSRRPAPRRRGARAGRSRAAGVRLHEAGAPGRAPGGAGGPLALGRLRGAGRPARPPPGSALTHAAGGLPAPIRERAHRGRAVQRVHRRVSRRRISCRSPDRIRIAPGLHRGPADRLHDHRRLGELPGDLAAAAVHVRARPGTSSRPRDQLAATCPGWPRSATRARFWSPFWRVYYVLVPADTPPDRYRTARDDPVRRAARVPRARPGC